MSQVPFPAPGHDGDEPSLPGAAARDGRPGDEAAAPPRDETIPAEEVRGDGDDDAYDAAADLARLLDDIEAGLIPVPPEGERVSPVMFCLGETADVDPVELARMTGPEGLGGQVFAQDRPADAMRPGPLLSVLTEQAAQDAAGLNDDELLGMVSAARRLQSRAQYLELAGIAEFARRRAAQYGASVAAKARPGRRDGEFADDELANELVMSRRAAGDRMELAAALTTRLPRTFDALAAGLIDGDRATVIWSYTRFLSDADAAYADELLAAAAPGLRYEQLAGKAYRLEMKLDPEGVRRRREEARRQGRRVETRRELSGNMSFGGRELSAAEALALKAANDADALALRYAGVAGSLRELRVLAMLDRMLGRAPAARLATGGDSDDRCCQSAPGVDDDPDDDAGGGPGGPGGSPAGGPAPLPALINLLVPAGALYGWSDAAAEAGTWGLLDPADTRALVHAASQHPRTRWCVTVVGADGTAVAHGCARGRHPWTPPDTIARDGPARPHDATGPPGPPRLDPHQQAQLAELLRTLNITFSPIARGSCDHRHREDRYTPSRALQHLVRARTARCTAPGCGAQAEGDTRPEFADVGVGVDDHALADAFIHRMRAPGA